MGVDRGDGRTPNQMRPLACSRNLLHRAHGSARWSQGNTIVLAAVYGPKAGTRKGENPELASIEVVWKPKTGQTGKQEKEYEIILRRTLRSICLLTVHPNTTTSVILQVVGDDGALLPCAINASCAALVDAGIPLKHLTVAVCCGLTECGSLILDPTKIEEQKLQAFANLVFSNPPISVIPKGSSSAEEPFEHGIITSVTHGAMPVDDYFNCLERGRAACSKISEFFRKSLQTDLPDNASKGETQESWPSLVIPAGGGTPSTVNFTSNFKLSSF
ncbi:putative ribosomal protein S5 domain 2-type [Dioscorea sansibarensis]